MHGRRTFLRVVRNSLVKELAFTLTHTEAVRKTRWGRELQAKDTVWCVGEEPKLGGRKGCFNEQMVASGQGCSEGGGAQDRGRVRSGGQVMEAFEG